MAVFDLERRLTGLKCYHPSFAFSSVLTLIDVKDNSPFVFPFEIRKRAKDL